MLADYYSRPIELAHGDGVYVYDKVGRKYLDFLAGWCVGNVGWKQKDVVEAIKKEAERGLYVPPVFKFAPWDKFAALLVKHAPNPALKRAIRCTSGSEAVEIAIKCARAATNRTTIVSVERVYHGHTYGAASVGDACTPNMAPGVPNMLKISMPDEFRGVCDSDVLSELENIFKTNPDIAAFLSEPVWTNAGVFVPPVNFYSKVMELCKKYGILFIADEVATGFGRCGRLFASELWDIKADIMCLGKGMTGGFATMGAVLVTEEIYKSSLSLPLYSTFGWLPQDLAATQANVEVILRDQLWKNSTEVGEYLLDQLKPLEKYEFVGQVRGIGLLIGIEIVIDKINKQPDLKLAGKLQDACADSGLLIETAHNNLFISPPLILTKAEAKIGAEIIKKVVATDIPR